MSITVDKKKIKELKHIATGLDLIIFIENQESDLSDFEVADLLFRLNKFFLLLRQKRCNPLGEQQLDEAVKQMKTYLSETEYQLIQTVVSEWKKTVCIA